MAKNRTKNDKIIYKDLSRINLVKTLDLFAAELCDSMKEGLYTDDDVVELKNR
jgi:hypothetical protein